MSNKVYRLMSVVVLFLLLIAAIFAPSAFFNIVDNGRENQVITIPIDNGTAIPEHNDNEIDNLEQSMRLIDHLGSKNMLAIQKKQVTDSELKTLQLELNKLRECGLIHGIWVTALSDHFVYVAYYNVLNSALEDSDIEALSIKEYKFSDYANFEYSFWVNSESGKIYEVMLIDDNEDFTLTKIDYMNGVEEYYGINTINPIEQTNKKDVNRYQTSINDYHTTSYYSEYSIYNPSEGSFVADSEGINWSIFSRTLSEK